MSDLLKFFDKKRRTYGMRMELGYSKTCDWLLRIWRKGVADDGGDVTICTIQHPDLEYVLARGQVELKEFLMDTEGGY